jgi:7-keto-8-aminopelargonate synthetase-like enzyme
VRAAGREVLNLCANNYLGLGNHPAVREAAHRAIAAFTRVGTRHLDGGPAAASIGPNDVLITGAGPT